MINQEDSNNQLRVSVLLEFWKNRDIWFISQVQKICLFRFIPKLFINGCNIHFSRIVDVGYEPIIAIICTFCSLIPNFSSTFKDSVKARNLKIQTLEKSCWMPYAMFNAPKEYRNLENLRVTAKIEKMVIPDSLF